MIGDWQPGPRTVLSYREFYNAPELIVAIGELLADSKQDPASVYVRCVSGHLHDCGRAYLVEERLMDGSTVFHIELEPAPVTAMPVPAGMAAYLC